MSVTRSHNLSVGIVGLPNAGKSTLFNSLTQNSVAAENFPFTTIDKNVGVVQIPDKRLDSMEDFFSAKKRVPSAITFVDIAGLVKGASKGEGLGNQFLSHIREVDVILYVLRSFSDEKVVHVYDRVSPVDDFEIVQAELIFKDLDTIDKQLGKLEKDARNGVNKEAVARRDVARKLFEWLNNGKPVIEMTLDEDEQEIVDDLWLLTSKRRMFLLNIQQDVDGESIEKFKKDLKENIGEDGEFVVVGDVKVLGELSHMEEKEQKEFLEMFEGIPLLMDDVVGLAYKRLNLITFYTGSEKEVNSWTIVEGSTVKESAGVIHSDLSDGFITADVINVEKLIALGGNVQAKEVGEVKNMGKDYVTKDGDYVVIYSGK